MRKDSVRRAPDFETPEARNVGWALLPRRSTPDCNMTIVVQRFEPGGDFEDHRHDLEQYFFVTRGRLEMTIGGRRPSMRKGISSPWTAMWPIPDAICPTPRASFSLSTTGPRTARIAWGWIDWPQKLARADAAATSAG